MTGPKLHIIPKSYRLKQSSITDFINLKLSCVARLNTINELK